MLKLLYQKLKKALRKKSGLALIQALLLITVISGLLLTIVTLTLLGMNISKQGVRQTSVLDIAEAGINYYLWHLVHDPDDYQDGTGGPGPYVHDFTDDTGTKIGTFTLTITPPGGGSDLVTVESRGDVEGGNENRTIVAKLGIPTFAQYAAVANDTTSHIRFGQGTEVFGPIHNNGGVRFDGIAHGLVSSSMATYDDPDHSGPNEDGVHTHFPPNGDVFLGGRSFPVPQVDFNQVTADLSAIKDQAINDGYYYAPSGNEGYRIVLKTNDTYDIYRVTSVTDRCRTPLGWQETYGIPPGGETVVQLNVSFPSNGVIFVEDDLWVEGKIDVAELTIATGRFPDTPSTNTNIYINNDIEYTNMDGQDKIGLIAQNNISVGLYSEGSFTGTSDEQELLIHAALLAQKGRVGRNYYPYRYWYWGYKYCLQSSDNYWQRNKITVYGSVGTARRYGFAWICGTTWTIGSYCDSGYYLRDLIYDQNLSTGPPPSWPTIGNYAILDWREE